MGCNRVGVWRCGGDRGMVGNSPCHAMHRVCLSDESQRGNGDAMNHFGVSKGSKGSHLMTFCDCKAWEGAVTLGIAQLGASTSRLLMFPGAPAHQTPGLSIFFFGSCTELPGPRRGTGTGCPFACFPAGNFPGLLLLTFLSGSRRGSRMSPCFPVLGRARKGREGKIPALREAPPCCGVVREMGAAC